MRGGEGKTGGYRRMVKMGKKGGEGTGKGEKVDNKRRRMAPGRGTTNAITTRKWT